MTMFQYQFYPVSPSFITSLINALCSSDILCGMPGGGHGGEGARCWGGGRGAGQVGGAAGVRGSPGWHSLHHNPSPRWRPRLRHHQSQEQAHGKALASEFANDIATHSTYPGVLLQDLFVILFLSYAILSFFVSLLPASSCTNSSYALSVCLPSPVLSYFISFLLFHYYPCGSFFFHCFHLHTPHSTYFSFHSISLSPNLALICFPHKLFFKITCINFIIILLPPIQPYLLIKQISFMKSSNGTKRTIKVDQYVF